MNYVIAAPVPIKHEALSAYNIFGVVHHGTLEDAEVTLKTVKEKIERDRYRSSYSPKAKDYKIYKLTQI